MIDGEILEIFASKEPGEPGEMEILENIQLVGKGFPTEKYFLTVEENYYYSFDSNDVNPVNLNLPDGTSIKCWFYCWLSPPQFTLEYGEEMCIPVLDNTVIMHGCICPRDDIEANEKAIKAFNNMAPYIMQ